MISKILSGKSLAEAVEYNEQKVREGVAELIDISNIGSANYVKETLEKVSGFNQRCQKPAFHLSLSFPADERELSDRELSQIAKDFMTRFGFGEHPYVVYRHRDTNHPHIHIVSTRISWKGEYKNVHQEHRLASKISGEIEEKYGLIRVDRSQKKKESKAKRIIPGTPDKNNVRQHITDAITNTLAERKSFDITAFEERLKSFGVGMKVREEKVSYYLINEEGKQTTRAIPASSIFIPTKSASFSPTYKKLNAVFSKQRKAEVAILKKKFLWLQKYDVVSKKAFENFLDKNNLKIKYSENSGGIYGISFIDTKNGVVFKGSDIDCPYAFLKEILSEKATIKKGYEQAFIEKCYWALIGANKRFGEQRLLAKEEFRELFYEQIRRSANDSFALSYQKAADEFIDSRKAEIEKTGGHKNGAKGEAIKESRHGSIVDTLANSALKSGGGLLRDLMSAASSQPKDVVQDNDEEEDNETRIKILLGKLIK